MGGLIVPVPLYALVIEEEKRVAKTGKAFWQVLLKTKAGNIKAFMWNAPDDVATNTKYPHVGDVILVSSFQDNMNERGNIVIEGFGRTTREELFKTVPQDAAAICDVEKASDDDMKSSLDLIADASFWDDRTHHTFTIGCLGRLDKEKFRACPAATKVHHSYQGGLIVHTAEVLALAKAVAETSLPKYSFINKDVLFASAILHDIGKVETYYINKVGISQQLSTEKSIGHIYYGMALVQEHFKSLKAGLVKKEFVDEVLHCIASHHGLPEWGSIKPVQSVEAGILSRVDYISARNGMVEIMLKESVKTGVPLQDEFRIYGDPYFASIGMKSYVRG